MSSSLLFNQTFYLNEDTRFDCLVLKIVGTDESEEFWFKAKEIATFLEYTNVRQAIRINVPLKYQRNWQHLQNKIGKNDDSFLRNVPKNWQPGSVFISEPGLYALIFKSKKPEAIRFSEWIYEKVLPSLRKNGTYSLKREIAEKDSKVLLFAQALITANHNLSEANNRIYTLAQQFAKLTDEDISRPINHDVLQIFILHKLTQNAVSFTRCQKKSLYLALKRLQKDNNNKIKELFRTAYIPNGTNIINSVKEKLREENVPFIAKNNKIVFKDEIHDDFIINLVKGELCKNVGIGKEERNVDREDGTANATMQTI